jgi:hypothetical protein
MMCTATLTTPWKKYPQPTRPSADTLGPASGTKVVPNGRGYPSYTHKWFFKIGALWQFDFKKCGTVTNWMNFLMWWRHKCKAEGQACQAGYPDTIYSLPYQGTEKPSAEGVITVTFSSWQHFCMNERHERERPILSLAWEISFLVGHISRVAIPYAYDDNNHT